MCFSLDYWHNTSEAMSNSLTLECSSVKLKNMSCVNHGKT
jgi:hypothetical protein